MTEVIVLTAAEMEKVRGRSPVKDGCEIDPVALKDGRFMLGPQVLDDPAHDDVREFLRSRPLVPLERLPLYGEDDQVPEAPIDAGRLAVRLKIAAETPSEKTR